MLTLTARHKALISAALDREGDAISQALKLLRTVGEDELSDAMLALKERNADVATLKLGFQLSTDVHLSRNRETEAAQ